MNLFKNLFPGGLFSFSGSVSWQEVQKWIAVAGNPENIGVGFARLGQPAFPKPRNPYAELRKKIIQEGIRLHGAIYFNPNQGAASTRTWEVKKLDSEFEKMFGHNLRIRINI